MFSGFNILVLELFYRKCQRMLSGQPELKYFSLLYKPLYIHSTPSFSIFQTLYMSFMCNMSSLGPKTDPWGTPQFISIL